MLQIGMRVGVIVVLTMHLANGLTQLSLVRTSTLLYVRNNSNIIYLKTTAWLGSCLCDLTTN